MKNIDFLWITPCEFKVSYWIDFLGMCWSSTKSSFIFLHPRCWTFLLCCVCCFGFLRSFVFWDQFLFGWIQRMGMIVHQVVQRKNLKTDQWPKPQWKVVFLNGEIEGKFEVLNFKERSYLIHRMLRNGNIY